MMWMAGEEQLVKEGPQQERISGKILFGPRRLFNGHLLIFLADSSQSGDRLLFCHSKSNRADAVSLFCLIVPRMFRLKPPTDVPIPRPSGNSGLLASARKKHTSKGSDAIHSTHKASKRSQRGRYAGRKDESVTPAVASFKPQTCANGRKGRCAGPTPLAPLQGQRGPPFVLLVCHSPILTHLLALLVGAFDWPRRHHALVEAAAQVQIGTVVLVCWLACLTGLCLLTP